MRWKKILFSQGEGDIGMSSMLLMIAMIFIFFVFTAYTIEGRRIRLLVNSLDDGIDLTNLASPAVDNQAFKDAQFSFIIWDAAIEDFHYIDVSGDEILVSLVPEDTYDAFLEISDVNVINQLEHNVRIEQARMTSLIIYNVDKDGNITVYTYQEGADKTMYTTDYIASGAGSYTAPDGTIINKTSIYSKVMFDYFDVFGQKHENLHVDQCTSVRAVW